jgi:hypothetical protein
MTSGVPSDTRQTAEELRSTTCCILKQPANCH